ncbi:helix-turn-helix domain-containing protein [Streptococcus suis]|uniref:helix-turn-helix domain-containing protein n=1 Tax=Streptococcus suis TaxID=1307 RepID=UPI000407C48F|nr:helix-turn-helix transcriptional regulator [Streptococcus suis]
MKEFVSKQIRLLRLKKGMTQEALAEKASLGFNYIYRLENKDLNVKIDTIQKVMEALEVDTETFFQVENIERDKDFSLLIEDIEHLPQEKRESTIKALRDILKQIQ